MVECYKFVSFAEIDFAAMEAMWQGMRPVTEGALEDEFVIRSGGS